MHPKSNTPEGETLHVALLLIKEYEDKRYPVPVPDPIESIKLRMQERCLKNKGLVGKIGTKGYVSAVLNKKKPLTLELAKMFHRELGISADVYCLRLLNCFYLVKLYFAKIFCIRISSGCLRRNYMPNKD